MDGTRFEFSLNVRFVAFYGRSFKFGYRLILVNRTARSMMGY